MNRENSQVKWEWGLHGNNYLVFGPRGYESVYSHRWVSKFRRNILSPSCTQKTETQHNEKLHNLLFVGRIRLTGCAVHVGKTETLSCCCCCVNGHNHKTLYTTGCDLWNLEIYGPQNVRWKVSEVGRDYKMNLRYRFRRCELHLTSSGNVTLLWNTRDHRCVNKTVSFPSVACTLRLRIRCELGTCATLCRQIPHARSLS